MLLGYNTNGFAHHALEDCCAILAEIGYKSVALTLEAVLLDPPDRSGVREAVRQIKPLLAKYALRATIETGSRFLLDPRRKHWPTLISASAEARRRRVAFLLAAVEVAAELEADSVSFWSGAPDVGCSGGVGQYHGTVVDGRAGKHGPCADEKGHEEGTTEEELWSRLQAGIEPVLDHARRRGVRLAFEPEPGMFIDTMAKFARLAAHFDDPHFGLTLDVGHVHCLGDGDIAQQIKTWQAKLFNVHIEDMRRGVHEHLMFGEGEIDFPGVVAALKEIGYRGPVHVELARHAHNAVSIAQASFDFLASLA